MGRGSLEARPAICFSKCKQQTLIRLHAMLCRSRRHLRLPRPVPAPGCVRKGGWERSEGGWEAHCWGRAAGMGTDSWSLMRALTLQPEQLPSCCSTAVLLGLPVQQQGQERRGRLCPLSVVPSVAPELHADSRCSFKARPAHQLGLHASPPRADSPPDCLQQRPAARLHPWPAHWLRRQAPLPLPHRPAVSPSAPPELGPSIVAR